MSESIEDISIEVGQADVRPPYPKKGVAAQPCSDPISITNNKSRSSQPRGRLYCLLQEYGCVSLCKTVNIVLV